MSLLPKILLSRSPRLAGTSGPHTSGDGGMVVVGWREWVGLDGLGIARLAAKIDTGARSCALHANSITPFSRGGAPWVRFDVTGETEIVPWHEAEITGQRPVRSSNGETSLRVVIRSELELAGRTWPVEITLTNRERMELPMLIGREALSGRFVVDPAQSWLWGQPSRRELRAPKPAARQRRRPLRTGEPG